MRVLCLVVAGIFFCSAIFGQPGRDTVRVKVKGHKVILIEVPQIDSSNQLEDSVPSVPQGPTEAKLTFTDIAPFDGTAGAVLIQNGRVIRNLFANKAVTSGSNNFEYDPIDEAFDTITDLTNAHVEITYTNATYTWDGVIGNTSYYASGDSVHQGYASIQAVAATGSKVYYSSGYTEGGKPQNWFSQSNPQVRNRIFGNEGRGTNQVSIDVATDGTNVYWAGGDPFAPRFGPVYKYVDFVFATKVSDNTETIFSSGVQYKAAIGRTYRSVVGFSSDSSKPMTGVAVQTGGNFLFIAYTSEVKVFNKTTGALIATNVLPCEKIACYSTTTLFVTAGTAVKKYTVDGSGVMTLAATYSGFQDLKAIATNGDTVVVADAGTSQLVKAISAINGVNFWTLGTAGGYYKSSAASNYKFYFSDDSSSYPVSISYANDGSFYLVDGGNFRAVHFNSARTYVDHVQYIPNCYNVYCDPKNPTRVFANYLEFSVDYTKPMEYGNGSWTFVANWLNNPITLQNYDKTFTIRPIQFSNGRTYSAIPDNYGITYYTNNRYQMVELIGDSIRSTGTYVKPFTGGYLHWDNDFYWMGHRVFGKPVVYYKRKLTGFDVNNNPQYGADSIIATVNYNPSDPYYGGQARTLRPGEKTSNGNLLIFNGTGSFFGYHLGAVEYGDTSLTWRTARSTHEKYSGNLPLDNYYDVGNLPNQYPGGVALALDSTILWNHHGEFWKNSQTNKWYHLSQNGTNIGAFGTVGPDLPSLNAAPEMAGNVSSASMVKYGDTLYVYHNDEGHHSGIHRWSIRDYIATTRIVTPSITQVPIDTLETHLMDSLSFNSVLVNGTSGWYRNKDENYTDQNRQWVSITTNAKSYDVFSRPDIYMNYRDNLYSPGLLVYKQFPATNQSTWSLTGEITFDGNIPSIDFVRTDTSGLGNVFLDVVDYNNKVLLRLYAKYNDVTRTFTDYLVNNQLLWRDSSFNSNLITKKWQPFSVTCVAGALNVSYAGHSWANISPLDATANKSRPDRIRVYMWSKSNNNARRLGLKEFVFNK